jgi:pimeloyl-ACP methyl ester carboxylesterase
VSPAAWIAGLAVALALVLTLLWLAIGWVGHWRLNRPPGSTRPTEFTFTPWETDASHEVAEFTTADGVRLHGWFLRREGERRVVVVMHGYRGEKSDVLGMSTALWRAGFSVLLFDFRGRGRSAPAAISMGFWETSDLTAALDWVADRVPDARVGLLGFSMGAVVAILGADERVRAIVADSVFASQREVLAHAAARDARRFLRGLVPGEAFLPAMEWWHRRSGRPGFDAIAPVRRLAALARTPILLIHGTRDYWIPIDHFQRLAEAAPASTESWIVDGALHCGAYFVDRPGYCARVAAFFEAHLGER